MLIYKMPKIKVIIALVLWVQLFFILTAQKIVIDNETELLKLPNDITPEHYYVKLNLDNIEKGFFTGTCDIFLKLNAPFTEEISFHMKLPYVNIEPSSIKFVIGTTKHMYKPTMYIYYVKSQVLKLERFVPAFDFERFEPDYHLSEYPFKCGRHILKISFDTTLYDEESLFNASYMNKDYKIWLLNTQPAGIRRIFPCWDEPTFKATFNFLIQHLTKHTVLSNMPGKQLGFEYSQLPIMSFEETLLIPSSFIVIMVSNFPLISFERINLRCRQQAALSLTYAEMIIKNITIHMESQWKHCKKLVKVNHIAIPAFLQESINKYLGFVFYRETTLMYDEELDPVMHKINVARLVARAVAHQCFNDMMSLSSWGNMLKEGIFMLLGINGINKIYPDFRILDLFVVQTQQESLRLDTHSIMMPFMSEAKNTENNPFFYHIKIPVIIRMLQHVLGDETFSNVIKIFIKKEHKDLTFNDLWNMLFASNELYNNFHILEIKNMMNSWIRLKYCPVLKVTQHDSFHVKISIENALNQTVKIPVTFTTKNYSNFNNTSPFYNMWLTPHINIYSNSILLHLNLSDWIIINIQQAGYYRVNYDAMYWERIIHYLKTSEEYTKIHVLNRAQIIDDVFYFMMNDQLPLSTFLKLTEYLQRETDYVAWYPMIKALEHISGFFLYEESAHMKVYTRNMLDKLLRSITYTERSYEKPNFKCLRQEAAKWACILGETTCFYAATSKLDRTLDDNERVLPYWKKWTYCNGMMYKHSASLKVFETWVNEPNTKLLEYLFCSASPIITVFLNTLINESVCTYDPITRNCTEKSMLPRMNVFLLSVAKHAKNDEILQHILKHFLTSRKVSWYVTLIVIINHLESEDQLNQVFDFVKDYKKRIGEPFNFKFTFDDQHKLNRKTYKTMEILNQMDYVPIMIVKQKIDLRLSEIENQLNYYQNLVPN